MTFFLVLALFGCTGSSSNSSSGGTEYVDPAVSSGSGSSGSSAGGAAVGGTTGGKSGFVTDPRMLPGQSPIDGSACNEIKPTEPQVGCVTGEIKCGDVVRGHTVGGGNQFDTKFYESKRCWPATWRRAAGW